MLRELNEQIVEYNFVHMFDNLKYNGDKCKMGIFNFYPNKCDEEEFLSTTVYKKTSFDNNAVKHIFETMNGLKVMVSVFAVDDQTAKTKAYQLFEFLENVCNVFPNKIPEMAQLVSSHERYFDDYIELTKDFATHGESIRCEDCGTFEHYIQGNKITKWCVENSKYLLVTGGVPIQKTILLSANMIGAAKKMGKTAQSYLLIRSAIESLCTKTTDYKKREEVSTERISRAFWCCGINLTNCWDYDVLRKKEEYYHNIRNEITHRARPFVDEIDWNSNLTNAIDYIYYLTHHFLPFNNLETIDELIAYFDGKYQTIKRNHFDISDETT